MVISGAVAVVVVLALACALFMCIRHARARPSNALLQDYDAWVGVVRAATPAERGELERRVGHTMPRGKAIN